MFIIENKNTKLPIKVWLNDEKDLEQLCLDQAYNLSNLPFLRNWVALMPDTHAGMGMPIGAIIAAKDNIIPNAVGVDIGCGMGFVSTNVKISDIKNVETDQGSLLKNIVNNILRDIPTGFNKHKTVQNSQVLDKAKQELNKYEFAKNLLKEIDAAYYQIGSLGGGNHFIELQEDDHGYLCIMVHSGSRNFGKQVCDTFHELANQLNEQIKSPVPKAWRLAHLPTDTPEGIAYINWMTLALNFALENRAHMMAKVQAIITKSIKKYLNEDIIYSDQINAHHNYANYEECFGEKVWIHRKGAISAKLGEKGIIPGAMGSFSYIVEGLGNVESFCSSAHGAGRLFSRTAAMKKFAKDDVLEDLQALGVTLGKKSKRDVAEESRFAYKDIDQVMANQHDVVKILKKLSTIAVVKG